MKPQGLTNPLSGCPGQVKIFAGQVKYFLTCSEKCMRYIGKTKEIQYFVAEVLYRTSRSNFDLSSTETPSTVDRFLPPAGIKPGASSSAGHPTELPGLPFSDQIQVKNIVFLYPF